jgi:hypothetical protein
LTQQAKVVAPVNVAAAPTAGRGGTRGSWRWPVANAHSLIVVLIDLTKGTAEMSANTPVNHDQLAYEVRSELIRRIRADEAFALALIDDPVGPLAGTELASKLDALQSDEVHGYKTSSGGSFESNCCITIIY